MIFDIRLPSITAPTDAGKIEEIRSYLFQTVKEINFALNSIDGVNPTEVESKEVDVNSLFAALKPMIIRSADILNTYYDIIKNRLDDYYVSKLDFATLQKDVSDIDDAIIKINESISGINNEIGVVENYVDKIKEWITFQDGYVEMQKPYTGTHKHSSVSGSIFTFTQSCADGLTPVVTSSATTGIPDGYTDCVGTIQKISGNTVIQITDLSTGSIATNIYSSGEWSGWKFLTPQ